VLVFRQTGSVAATALTYAATLLPAVLGGYVLAGIGDRLPRRAVMVGCDLVRAGLFALMALPQLPLPYVVGLLVVAVFVEPAFSASEVSVLAATLDPDQFRSATGIRMVTNQAAQVGGFAFGGALVAWLHPRGALLVDAATYAASAALIRLLLRNGSADSVNDCAPDTEDAGKRQPFLGLWGDSRVRGLVALSALAGCFIVPEGLAVPFSSRIGVGPTETGILLAAIPLGGALGALLLTHGVRPSYRPRAASLMAMGCGLPLLVSAANPSWPVAWVTWLVSGLLAAYQVEVLTVVVHAIPDRIRTRSLGIVSAWLVGAQGAGLALFGALARQLGVGETIGLAGLIGSGLALALVAGPLRHWQRGKDEPVGRHRMTASPTTRSRS
jgi:predicted MFS family arabinose efflux permease